MEVIKMSLSIINGVNDISALKKEGSTVLGTKHLFIKCDYRDVRDALMDLIEEKNIYSVLLQSSEDADFTSDAQKVEAVPFFLASDDENAGALVADLIKDPVNVSVKAINGDSVALRFSEGFPS
jgi:hypothetical protein